MVNLDQEYDSAEDCPYDYECDRCPYYHDLCFWDILGDDEE